MRTIGIDIGTSSVKAVLCRVGAEVVVERTVCKPYGEDGRPTRDPDLWVRLAKSAITELRAHGPVAAVGFTGQMHALVALDARGAVAAPVKLWLDMDGAAALRDFVRHVHDGSAAAMARRTGNIPLPDFTLAKWLHALGADPTLDQRVVRLCCAKDFVRQQLDPKAPHVVDRNEAVGMQLFDPFADRWNGELVAAAGIPCQALPTVVDAATVAGRLADGTPLVVGVGDQASAARAIGAFEPGTVSLSLGTSGRPLVHARAPAPGGRLERRIPPLSLGFHAGSPGHRHHPRLRWHLALALVAPGAIDRRSGPVRRRNRTRQRAGDLPALSRGCRGAAPPARARGPAHRHHRRATPARLVRTVYDGLAQEFAIIAQEAAVHLARGERVMISGGAARLTRLVGTIAAFLDAEICVVDAGEASAVGAALIAADTLAPGTRARLTATPVPRTKRVAPTMAWRKAREAVLAEAGPDTGLPVAQDEVAPCR